MNISDFTADFNHPAVQSDETCLLICVRYEGEKEKYIKLAKPITRNELSAALHFIADKIKET